MPPSTSTLNVMLPWYVPAIIGAALVLSSVVGSYTFYAVRSLDNVLTVTGSTKTRVTSDSVKWTLSISRKVTEAGVPLGYKELDRDLEAVKEFLKANGVTDEELTTMPVALEEIYRYDGNTGPREFNLRQNIVVLSSNVTVIDALAKRVSEVTSKGILVSNNWLEFYVTNLPELRISLLGDAVKDARARAEEIAIAGEQRVGSLKSASSGVVQVLSPNSIEVADYGQYDTQSIEKDVFVTVRATFFVR